MTGSLTISSGLAPFAVAADPEPSDIDGADATPVTAPPTPPPTLPGVTDVRPNPVTEPPLRITLQDALDLALEENPGVEAVEARIARAEARVNEVASAIAPQVSAVGSFTRQGPISSFSIPTGENQPPQTVRLGSPSSKTLVFTARKNLDLSGTVGISKDIARRGITTAELDLERAQADLLLAVYDRYYNVLRSRQFIRVAEDAVTAAEDQRRVADAQYRAGTAAQFDVIRASVQVENLRQQLASAIKNADIARAALLNTLGINPVTSIEVEEIGLPVPAPSPSLVPAAPEGTTGAPPTPPGTMNTTPAPQDGLPAGPDSGAGLPAPDPGAGESAVVGSVDPESPLPLELIRALREAFANRPEIRNAANSVRIAERGVDVARRGRRPEMALSGQYNFTPDVSGFAAVTESWSLNAQVTVPIFEGGAVRSRVEQARSDVAAARASLESARQGVALEIRTALLDLQEALTRRQTASANVTQAREALRIARVRFEAGVSTSVEQTDAQAALTQAQTNQVNADYDYLSAEAQLRRSLGRLAPEATRRRTITPPGPPPPDPVEEMEPSDRAASRNSVTPGDNMTVNTTTANRSRRTLRKSDPRPAPASTAPDCPSGAGEVPS